VGVIETAVDDILGDADLAQSMTYTPTVGDPVSLTRGFAGSCPREYLDAGGVRVLSGMRTFWIVADDLALEPTRGDTITFQTETYDYIHHERKAGGEHYEVDMQLVDA